jgi:hypothetical protein
MLMFKRRSLAAGGVVVVLLLLAFTAGSAIAHAGDVWKDNRAHALTHTSHAYTDSCDELSDGLRERAWAGEFGIAPGPLSWDPDGAGGLCAHNQFTHASWEKHKVCVEVVGCAPDPGYIQHF